MPVAKTSIQLKIIFVVCDTLSSFHTLEKKSHKMTYPVDMISRPGRNCHVRHPIILENYVHFQLFSHFRKKSHKMTYPVDMISKLCTFSAQWICSGTTLRDGEPQGSSWQPQQTLWLLRRPPQEVGCDG